MDTPLVSLNNPSALAHNDPGWTRKRKVIILIASLFLPPLGLTVVTWILINKSKNPNLKMPISLLIIAVVIGGCGYYVLYKATLQSKPAAHPFSYMYRQLLDSSITGPADGNGISFKRPAEFTPINPGAAKTVIANFAQDVDNNGNTNTIGGQAVYANVAPTDYYSIMSRDLKLAASTSGYQNAILSIKNFLKSEIPYIFFYSDKNAKISLSVNRPTYVFRQNLINGAWVFDYAATDTNLVNNKQQISTIKGEVILTIGKTDFYYVLLGTVDYNWNANSFLWGTILSDLKIDQPKS